MKKNIIILISFFMICFYFLLCATTERQQFLGIKSFFINDFWDRSAYFSRGSWYPLKKIPYKDIFEEYPPLAVYVFATPFLCMPKNVEYFYDNFLASPVAMSSFYTSLYSKIFSCFMGFAGILSAFITLVLLKILKKNQVFSLLYLLPASLFFTFNRFDILPALMVLLSLLCIYHERYKSASIFLGLGAALKMYPAILLPVFLAFYFRKYKKMNFKMISSFIATVFLIMLPVLLSAGFSILWAVFHSQANRGFNHESLCYIFFIFFPHIYSSHETAITTIFNILSVSMVPFALTAKINNFKVLIKWSALSLLTFIFFLNFYSPQWILWVIFLLILSIETKMDILKIALFQIITWLIFPIADIVYGQPSYPFAILVVLRILLIAAIIIPLIKSLFPQSVLFIHLCRKFRICKIE